MHENNDMRIEEPVENDKVRNLVLKNDQQEITDTMLDDLEETLDKTLVMEKSSEGE